MLLEVNMGWSMSFKIKLRDQKKKNVSNYCCCLGAKLCLTVCDPMNCSMPGFPFLLCLFLVGKFIKQISSILKKFFFTLKWFQTYIKVGGKNSSESPHIPLPSLPLEIMQIYIVSSNFQLASIYEPSLQQLCLPNDDFPFFHSFCIC